MNTVTAKRYQDLMQEFLKTSRSDAKGFRKKYEEVLNEFLNLDEVYVIASRSATVEEVKEKLLQLPYIQHELEQLANKTNEVFELV